MPNCDPELGAWTEPRWLECSSREPCGLWHGNLEGWVQFPPCHKDFWAHVSQIHWVTCNMRYSCASNIFTDSRSLLFLEFEQRFCPSISSSFSSQTWNAPGKCCARLPRKPFSPKSYPELQTEILNTFWDFWLISVNSKGSSNSHTPCVTTQDNVRFIFCSLLLQLRKSFESAVETCFEWYTKRLFHLMHVCVWKEWENWWRERISWLKGWCKT